MFERKLLLDYLPSLTKQMAVDLSKGSFVFSYVSCKKIELYFFSSFKSDKIMSKFKNEVLLLRKLQQKWIRTLFLKLLKCISLFIY